MELNLVVAVVIGLCRVLALCAVAAMVIFILGRLLEDERSFPMASKIIRRAKNYFR